MLFLARPAPQRMSHPLPILFYHSVGTAKSTPVRVFQQHMRHLKEAGHVPIGLKQFAAILENRADPAPRQVLITFDGDCRSLYLNAWPVLRQFGFPAALFVTVGAIQTSSGGPRPGDSLNWRELREMQDGGGIDIQSRGYSKGSFRPGIRFGGRWRRNKVRGELEIARLVLAENLSLAPEALNHLAWPDGYCDEELEYLASALGFTHQYIVRRGAVTRHGCTERLPRLCCDNLPLDSFTHQLRWLSHRNGARVVNLAGAIRRWSLGQSTYS
jgi:hypothetical protein